MQSWRYRVNYARGGTDSAHAEFAVNESAMRVGGSRVIYAVGGTSHLCIVGGTFIYASWRYKFSYGQLGYESAMQSAYRVIYAELAVQRAADWPVTSQPSELRVQSQLAELAVQSQLCRVGGTESAMHSWRYRVSYAELAFHKAMAKPNSIMIDAWNFNEVLIGKFAPPLPGEGAEKVGCQRKVSRRCLERFGFEML
eukprot:gene20502-27293_t